VLLLRWAAPYCGREWERQARRNPRHAARNGPGPALRINLPMVIHRRPQDLQPHLHADRPPGPGMTIGEGETRRWRGCALICELAGASVISWLRMGLSLRSVTVARSSASTPLLEPGEAEMAALPRLVLGSDEVAPCPLQGAEGLLGDAPQALLPTRPASGRAASLGPRAGAARPPSPPPLHLRALPVNRTASAGEHCNPWAEVGSSANR
jgi:hypothetical protein